MTFHSSQFLVFFLLFFSIYHGLLKTKTRRLTFITVGSLIFYGTWDFRFVPLLAGTALIDFYVARAIEACPKGSLRRKRWLLLSALTNLSTLAFFKYANFLIANSYGLLHLFGLSSAVAPILNIALPIGISFYTFQSLGYVIDVYRGHLQARQRPSELLAGVSFFPHLVAGPIIRATNLLPQFENVLSSLPLRFLRNGILLFCVGLLKKGIGDILGHESDLVFNSADPHTMIQSWIGTLAFVGQIYADFSGYSDMAIGIALLLGFELPKNFDQPYLATSPGDFWRRWHISLSGWLKDYLFAWLGGNQHRYRNYFLMMVIAGLWHGANWTFIAFGAIHGALLVVGYVLQKRFGHLPWSLTRGATALKIVVMFYITNITSVFFRAPSLGKAVSVIADMHSGQMTSIGTTDLRTLAFVLVSIVICHAINKVNDLPEEGTGELLRWATAGVVFAVGQASGGTDRPFIYFEF